MDGASQHIYICDYHKSVIQVGNNDKSCLSLTFFNPDCADKEEEARERGQCRGSAGGQQRPRPHHYAPGTGRHGRPLPAPDEHSPEIQEPLQGGEPSSTGSCHHPENHCRSHLTIILSINVR